MKKLFILFLFFTFDLSSQDCSEFFLIRHAEKDRTNPENKNPNPEQNFVNSGPRNPLLLPILDLENLYFSGPWNSETVIVVDPGPRKPLFLSILDLANPNSYRSWTSKIPVYTSESRKPQFLSIRAVR